MSSVAERYDVMVWSFDEIGKGEPPPTDLSLDLSAYD